MTVCAVCGEENPDRARFCLVCGSSLTAQRPAREVRKTVTVLFCDLVGSTSLGERLDPEALRTLLDRYFAVLQEHIRAHGGIVEKYIGDAVMAVFGIPLLHEDDALRAVRAAAAIPTAVERLGDELDERFGVRLQVRLGVSTGEVMAGVEGSGGQRLATGDAVNLAARLQGLAEPGGVVLAGTTHRLVRDAVTAEPLGDVAVKGKAEPVAAWRLLDVDPSAGRRLHTETRLVGRHTEIAALREAFERAVTGALPQRRVVLGNAGVGKSRLLADFVAGLPPGTTVLRGRCLSYGQGITFWPVREMVATAAGWAEDDTAAQALTKLADLLPGRSDAEVVADLIGQLLGLGRATATLPEAFWAVTQLLQELARWHPVVVVVDDLHWAEPSLLELVDHLSTRVEGPVLLLGGARPELLETRPGWSEGERIVLEPLSTEDAGRLLADLLGPGAPPPSLVRHVLATAEGNPLFVEQLVAMLLDDGVLVRSDDAGWALTAELGPGRLPDTIHGLLAARLERLAPAEQRELEAGAVVGRVFWRGAVAELAREAVGTDAGAHLDALVGRRLIHREPPSFDDDAYKFEHVLVRDAAYAGMSKADRAAAHQRFAVWLAQAAGERSSEYDEILGYHLEQAVLLRNELARPGDEDRRLALRAGGHLAAAGARSLGQGDLDTTLGLLRRAERLLTADPLAVVDVVTSTGQALWLKGDVAGAQERLTAARRRATELGDRARTLRAELALTDVRSWTDPTWAADGAVQGLSAWLAELEDLGDTRGLAEGWSLLGRIHYETGRSAAAIEALERALVHTGRLGHRAGSQPPLIWLLLALSDGATPVRTAVRRLEDLAQEVHGDLHVQCELLNITAILASMERDFQRARRLHESARTLSGRLGVFFTQVALGQVAFDLARREGRLGAAEGPLRSADEFLEAIGETSARSTVLAMLAHVHAAEGRFVEARRAAELGRSMTQPDDLASEVLWRTALALVESEAGAAERAESLASQAVDVLARTDQLTRHGDALMVRAEVRRRCGRAAGARTDAEAALALYRRKGDLASADQATSFLRSVSAAVG